MPAFNQVRGLCFFDNCLSYGGIIISVVFLIPASLFLLVGFDTIERFVENQANKKYKWMAAWGLAYTILYIYFKVLRLLLMIFGNRASGKQLQKLQLKKDKKERLHNLYAAL